MRKPELLVPASSLEVLKVAVIFGADAVYIGGEVFGLRAKAKNFSMEDMKEGVEFAHAHGVKVYVTANILAHNQDLEGVRAYFAELKEIGPDALIISDPGVYRIAMEVCPEIERHISTQANNTNYGTYQFWYEQGAQRVVTARELSLAEIKEIREHIPEEMEIETFIHGAMCISYSGRCLLSNYFTGRDANQGACTHPCRWKYAVVEESRPGEYLPEYDNLQELKDHYTRGGLGDVKIKKFLNNIMQEELSPIRARRTEYEKDIPAVYEILINGSETAREAAAQTMAEVKRAMRINYFEDAELIKSQSQKYAEK